MKTKIILVAPQYPENIGLIARAMENFGVKELLLVNPKASVSHARAKSRAMHAQETLAKARTYSSLEKALEEVDYAIATTAKTGNGKKIYRTAITPRKLAEKFAGTNAVIGIVFGREDRGLENHEIRQCDFIASIPANANYPTLNIGHAAAIFFYELFSANKKQELKTASRKTKKTMLEKVEKLVINSKTIENKESVMLAFKALLGRAIVTEKEARAMLSLFSEMQGKD